MRPALLTIILVVALALSMPHPVHAKWWGWGGGESQGELNLDSGYDANTVTTVEGRITAIHTDDKPQVRVDLETSDRRIVVLLGPSNYWAEHGIKLTVGERVTVRGSKAQGEKGVVYLLAQKIGTQGGGQEVALRNDSGQPAWSGGGNRGGFGSGSGGQQLQRMPSRMGGGRMGR